MHRYQSPFGENEMSQDLDETNPYRYRILSLDGGGVKGAYTASVLQTLETLTGKSVSDHFDMIVGTSTGGIIAVAIGLGVPLNQIVDLYVEQGPMIFPPPPTNWLAKTRKRWRSLWQPKHCQRPLLRAVTNVLEDRKFGESANRLVIPAFNAQSGDIQLFKTAHHPDYRMDCLLPATTVAMATSAAPTYLSAFKDPEGRVFIDGGVWANCPVVVGLVEAISRLNWPREQIDVLSIGTTSEPFHVGEAKQNGGLAQWNKGIIDIFQESQGRGMLGMARALTNNSMTRIDIATRPGRFALDGSEEVQNLRVLGEDSARQNLGLVEQRFFSTPTKKFKPYIPNNPRD